MELEPRTTAPAHATGAVAFVPLAALADDPTFRLREEGDVGLLAASLGRLGQLVPVELRPLPAGPGGAPRYQVVAGFRRIAALRLLARERVLARVHQRLDDDDAWGLALGQALLTEPLDGDGLRLLRERLRESGVAPWADDLVDEALVRAPVEPELRERFFEFLSGAPAPSVGEAEAVEGEADVDEGAPSPRAARDEGDASHDAMDAPPSAAGPREVELTPDELVADLATRLYEVSSELAVAFEAWSELPEEGRRTIVEQARWIAELLPHLAAGEDE
jgi:hypothetical protein